jgi:enediyne biosynthesis protein E2
MPTVIGSLRRLAMAPSLASVTFGRRGFPVRPSAVTERLEAIPQSVICGFEWAIDSRDQWEVERRLSVVETVLRGFAYEGATMAFTIRDVMGRGQRAREFLLGPAQPHIFLAYIGIGFAMARLPRRLWVKVLPDLTGSPYFPTMSWLAVDGYGFDRAYFDTRRWVDEQFVPAAYPWAGDPDYFLRAVDQGVGRALWFIHGANVPGVVDRVGGFASHRRADLWSGVGLAAAFAGGAAGTALADLAARAGEFRPELATGAILAAKARDYAGYVPGESADSTLVLAGMTVAEAVALADSTEEDAHRGGPLPAYELWRQSIRTRWAGREREHDGLGVERPGVSRAKRR